nr:MAG TPA: hypothetical protein [Caudoviricetes sp.]
MTESNKRAKALFCCAQFHTFSCSHFLLASPKIRII